MFVEILLHGHTPTPRLALKGGLSPSFFSAVVLSWQRNREKCDLSIEFISNSVHRKPGAPRDLRSEILFEGFLFPFIRIVADI